MTPDEWATSRDPVAMLDALPDVPWDHGRYDPVRRTRFGPAADDAARRAPYRRLTAAVTRQMCNSGLVCLCEATSCLDGDEAGGGIDWDEFVAWSYRTPAASLAPELWHGLRVPPAPHTVATLVRWCEPRIRAQSGAPLSQWDPTAATAFLSRVADLVRDTVRHPDLPPQRVVPVHWRTETVTRLAAEFWRGSPLTPHWREDDRLEIAPILADALQDAGCDDDGLLAHLRGAGPHCRGCWAVQSLLVPPAAEFD